MTKKRMAEVSPQPNSSFSPLAEVANAAAIIYSFTCAPVPKALKFSVETQTPFPVPIQAAEPEPIDAASTITPLFASSSEYRYTSTFYRTVGTQIHSAIRNGLDLDRIYAELQNSPEKIWAVLDAKIRSIRNSLVKSIRSGENPALKENLRDLDNISRCFREIRESRATPLIIEKAMQLVREIEISTPRANFIAKAQELFSVSLLPSPPKLKNALKNVS